MKRFKDIFCVVERIAACIKMPKGALVSTDLQSKMVSSHMQGLKSLVEPYHTRVEIKIKGLKGTPFLEIIREVLRYGHDLVIKIPETRDWLDGLFGSTYMHLLRKCPCPVWLTKPAPEKAYRLIMATVNVDDVHPPTEMKSRHALNRQVLELAGSLALARRLKADLVVMGTVALTGVPGFIVGNTAEIILNQIVCSVLAIKPPGFATPVTVEE